MAIQMKSNKRSGTLRLIVLLVIATVSWCSCKRGSDPQAGASTTKQDEEFSIRVANETKTLLNVINTELPSGCCGDDYHACFSEDNRWLIVTASFQVGRSTRADYGWVALCDVLNSKEVREWYTAKRFDNSSQHYQGEQPCGVAFVSGSSDEVIVEIESSREPRFIRFNVNNKNGTLPTSKPVVAKPRPRFIDRLDANANPPDSIRVERELADSLSIVIVHPERYAGKTPHLSVMRSYTGLITCTLPLPLPIPNERYSRVFHLLSPSARLLLSACKDNEMAYICDISSCKLVSTVQGTYPTTFCTNMLFSPDERTIVLEDDSTHIIRLHDVTTGKKIQDLAKYYTPLAFSQDGSLLALIGLEDITLWSK